MTTKAGVGISRHHNPSIAGREAAEQALEKAGVDRPDFVFMFATVGYDQHFLLRAVREQLGGEKPELVFQFECVTRGKMMFREQERLQILKRFRQSLDPDTPWVGFYTIGEIGPVEEHNDIHRLASVVLALS